MARVRAVPRRSGGGSAAGDHRRPLEVGEVQVDPGRRRATVAGRPLDLF